MADVDGDGRPDSVGSKYSADSGVRSVIVRLAAGGSDLVTVQSIQPADTAQLDQPILAYQLNPRPGSELVVPVSRGVDGVNFAVLSWRDGKLAHETPVGQTIDLRRGGWTFRASEGQHLRVICREGGQISLGDARTRYGGEVTGKSTITDFTYRDDVELKGEASRYVVSGERPASADEILDKSVGDQFFRCSSQLTEATGTPQPAKVTTAPASCGKIEPSTVPAVQRAVSKVGSPRGFSSAQWTVDSTLSHYSPCDDLSHVSVTAGSTGSSPFHILLFHKGEFIRTAAPCAMATSSVTGDGNVVSVTYKWLVGNESNAEAKGRAEQTYRWVGNGIQTAGPEPKCDR